MINLSVPQQAEPSLKPNITVIGVGGAGGNAVNNMIADNLQGVDFVVANTDAQAISLARTQRRIQLGATTTQGLGAGARPEVGRASAEETQDIIAEEIDGSNMVFITAGMGGGTGTGAAPVIARVARELGILTVGVVTKPFQFEGAHRMRLAETGIEELSQYVDTLIIIPNQNLFRVANEKTTFADAFKMADDVLNQGVRSITDLMIMPGLINLDFADVRTVMSDMGRAMMGTGEASGDRRALDAAEAAIANPLLEDTCMKGAKGVLINITGGPDITLFEVDEAANRIRDEVECEAHIIFGSCFDPELEGKMRVSVVATGITSQAMTLGRPQQTQQAAPQEPVGIVRADLGAKPAVAAQPAPATAAQPQQAPRTAAQRPAAPAAFATPRVGGGAQTAAAQAYAPAYASQPEDEPMEAPRQQSFHMEEPVPAPRKPADAFIPAEPAGRMTAPHQPAPQHAPAAERQMPRAQAQHAPQRVAHAPAAFAADPAEARSHAERSAAERTAGTARGSLFNRITAKLKSGDPEPQGMAEVEHHPAAAQAPSLHVDPADRPAPARHEEDELEIPAFLRRQAN